LDEVFVKKSGRLTQNRRNIVLKRYVDDVFDPDDTSTTIGVDFREKKVSIDGKPHRLLLHDTAGQESVDMS